MGGWSDVNRNTENDSNLLTKKISLLKLHVNYPISSEQFWKPSSVYYSAWMKPNFLVNLALTYNSIHTSLTFSHITET